MEVDGHDFDQLLETFKKIHNSTTNNPTVVIADTTKGKGVSFMENDPKWHHGGISDEIYELSLKELNGDSIDS